MSAPARILRRQEVEALTGISCATIYRWMKENRFPRPVRLGEQSVGWKSEDIAAWIASRCTATAAA